MCRATSMLINTEKKHVREEEMEIICSQDCSNIKRMKLGIFLTTKVKMKSDHKRFFASARETGIT